MPISLMDEFGIIDRDKDYKNLTSIPAPDWAKSSVIYEAYIRSFSKDGTFGAFTKRLPEIKELGIDTIWLMPIHSIGLLKRKGPLGSPYAIRDHFRVNPEYGKKEDFHELVQKVHEMDMRILIDLVSNHAANDHTEIKNHPDWFTTDDGGNFTRRIPGWSDVIDFNYDNKELRKYMKDMVVHWVKEYDIDGYRCDVAGMVPEDFWIDVRKDILKLKPDFLFIAEWEDPEMHLKTFDVTYDWMLYYKLYDIFKELAMAQDAVDLLLERNLKFPNHALRLHFLENHDQARTSYKFGVSSFQPYAAFIFAIAGIPLVYNGQEVGDTKYLSLFDKNPINWKIKGASAIRQFYKSLIKLRKSNSVFTDGDITKIENNCPDQIASFARNNGECASVIILNLSSKECSVALNYKSNRSSWQSFNITSLEQEPITVKHWKFTIKPYGGQILI